MKRIDNKTKHNQLNAKPINFQNTPSEKVAQSLRPTPLTSSGDVRAFPVSGNMTEALAPNSLPTKQM